MSNLDGGARTTSGNSAAEVFEREWLTYRKLVDNNYLFHREAYDCLRRIVKAEFNRPFQFLDIACGDASATVGALTGTNLAQYFGIDLSAAALAIAANNLRVLGCPVELELCDFTEALARWQKRVDVAWIGLSLHHLQAPEKLAVMRDVRRIIGVDGLLVIYENASPDGEDRAGWLHRSHREQSDWEAYLTREEWDAMAAHVRANDFPETTSRWQALGREAGFRVAQEVFVTPTDLYRMYVFRA
jgi:ubiquinone/menaquinone biosynthesis C-methylase UbiE